MIRMSRRVALAAGLSLPLTLRAGAPWKGKNPSEWSDEDLVRMLNDSPWAQKVDISFDSPDLSMVGGEHVYWREGLKPLAMPFVIRWLSALAYKEAYARAKYGRDEEALKRAKEYLGRVERHYLIGLICPPKLNPPKQVRAIQEKMKSETALKRLGKADIHPESVETVPGSRQAIVFRFPRSNEITLADGIVEFSTMLPLSWAKISIRRKFLLEEMIWQGRLAL